MRIKKLTFFPTHKININRLIAAYLILAACFLFSGCTGEKKTSAFTALVVSIYDEKTVLNNFMFHYWWQERGDTPFLKEYTHSAGELIVKRMIPFKDDPRRVSIRDERIALSEISSIDASFTATGKEMTIALKDGRVMTATDKFPNVLKKGKKTGFADYILSVEGSIGRDEDKEAFKLELEKIKHIKLL